MIWTVIIIFVVTTLIFFFGTMPIFSLDISSFLLSITSGIDYLMDYSGLVSFFLPMDAVQLCLSLLVTFYAIEWGYYGILYIIKIFK